MTRTQDQQHLIHYCRYNVYHPTRSLHCELLVANSMAALDLIVFLRINLWLMDCGPISMQDVIRYQLNWILSCKFYFIVKWCNPSSINKSSCMWRWFQVNGPFTRVSYLYTMPWWSNWSVYDIDLTLGGDKAPKI